MQPPDPGRVALGHALGALAIKACQHGHRTLFATAQQWVDRLEGAQHRNSLDDELCRLDRHQLLVIAQIGYLPLKCQAANLAVRPHRPPLRTRLDHPHQQPRL
jgi:DNA replication protein DnaC